MNNNIKLWKADFERAKTVEQLVDVFDKLVKTKHLWETSNWNAVIDSFEQCYFKFPTTPTSFDVRWAKSILKQHGGFEVKSIPAVAKN